MGRKQKGSRATRVGWVKRTGDGLTQVGARTHHTKEDEELRAGIDEAREEWKREGGAEAREFFRKLNAP